jgi:hypothetical protein
MRLFLLIVLAIATIWDAFTTVYGTVQVLGDGLFQLLAAILFSSLIFAFVLNTRRIMKWPGDFVGGAAKFFWFIALCYDLYTSWVGNAALIVQGSGELSEFVILIGLTLLVTASPILLSTMWVRRSRTTASGDTVSHSHA